MPDFTYTGAEERYYTDHGLTAHPGDVVSLEAPLDDSWVAAGGAPQPAAVVEPIAEPVAEPIVEDHSAL